jgi:phosphatidylcholine synthase
MTQLDQLHPIAPRRHKGGDPVVRLLAWGVHLYTALGLAAAAAIAVLLVRGGADSFRWSFVLMLVATLVDATDGTMARRVGVKKVLPNFDGRKLDDLTDFLTYTFLPLLLIWRAEVLPSGFQFWLLLPLLASAYGFCQIEAKTDDGYFLGFPSLWNVVAFYLYVLHLPTWGALGVLIVLSLLTFVPSRYLYPSQPGPLNAVSNVLGAVWACMLAWILLRLPTGLSPAAGVADATWNLTLVSLFYPAFYMIASWVITLKRWSGHSRRALH